MHIYLHKKFLKDYKKLSISQKERFKERRDLFITDEFNPLLNNHALKGEYLGYRSINITGDTRVILKRDSKSALFVAIDSYSNLYG